jgi:hypothetical protein
MDVAEMAAIDESNTTIGIADSDLYFASPAEVDAALDQMQAVGANTVRIGIPWAGINPIPGYYNWSQSDYMINAADARGMGVLAVTTTTPGWANDPSAPGIYGHPASPTDFGTFAGLAAQRYAGKVGAYEIWNEPNAAPFYGPQPDPAGYTELLKAAYPAITMPFSTGGWHPDSPINQLADIRDLMVANGDSGKLIWSSEYGEPTAVASERSRQRFSRTC